MFILTWILKLCSSSVIGKVTDYLTARSNDAVTIHGQDATAATQIVVAQMNAEVEARKVQKELAGQHGWIVGALGGLFVFHIGMIILDSVFHLNWNVAALPAPMDQWEGQIVLALCCVGPTTSLVNRVVARVWK